MHSDDTLTVTEITFNSKTVYCNTNATAVPLRNQKAEHTFVFNVIMLFHLVICSLNPL